MEINAILEDGGLDPCDDTQLIVRRVIGQTANRQFVNDSPVTLTLLKRLGEHLVDLHGPHDHQSLLSTERQLAMLDAYAGAENAVHSYREIYRAWRTKATELEELRHAENASEQELDLLRYQIQEIDAANLKPEDEQDLEDRWRRASNASRLVETAAAADGRAEWRGRDSGTPGGSPAAGARSGKTRSVDPRADGLAGNRRVSNSRISKAISPTTPTNSTSIRPRPPRSKSA